MPVLEVLADQNCAHFPLIQLQPISADRPTRTVCVHGFSSANPNTFVAARNQACLKAPKASELEHQTWISPLDMRPPEPMEKKITSNWPL